MTRRLSPLTKGIIAMAEDLAWSDYRETVHAADEDWVREHIIRPAIERDPTVAPWDDWRIVERDSGLQARIRKH